MSSTILKQPKYHLYLALTCDLWTCMVVNVEQCFSICFLFFFFKSDYDVRTRM